MATSKSLAQVILYLILMTLLTFALTKWSWVVWLFLLLTIVGFWARVRPHGGTWDSGMTRWFTVVKFVAALIGVVAMNISRGNAVWTAHCRFILILNIIEALVRDVQLSHWANAGTAFFLIVMIPSVAGQFVDANLFSFELSNTWVILYSAWNAVFTYGDNFAWTTRLVLLPPIFVSHVLLARPECWLGARCLSLLLHLVMRGTNFTLFYSPGSTCLTPVVGSVEHNSAIRVLCSVAVFVASVVVFARSIP
jgi:hypothetical protein